MSTSAPSPSGPGPDSGPVPAADAGTGPDPGRPARADARRNREKLLAAARAAFADADEAITLEGIARAAGVGIGTLYRHFPTREALVEAVYVVELEDLAASAPILVAELPAVAAMREWMDRYAAFAAAKRGMTDVFRTGKAPGGIATPLTRERLIAAITLILDAGARDGSLRTDVDADDVGAMLLGVFLSTAARDAPDQVGRLLTLIVDALRPFEGGTGQR